MQEEITKAVAIELGLIQSQKSYTRKTLIDAVNDLLQHDFNKLIAILYRADVDESKLRSLLQQHPTMDAAEIITDLLIERQVQKIKAREKFNNRNDNISEDEKW